MTFFFSGLLSALEIDENSAVSKTGIFDRFLKTYASTASVLDEPEISFVSCKTASNPATPSKNLTKTTNSSQATTFSTNSSSISSGISSESDRSFPSSLIHLQQKQLMKQFANMSPIELNNQIEQRKQQQNQHLLSDYTIDAFNSTSINNSSQGMKSTTLSVSASLTMFSSGQSILK